ncbi:DUF420 domain-containing protein [Gynurincola endophyticus]|uniref:DUF420 domain-containing protein n=1 Tax=Gynurincola endophyticus TaxID=2479004 RepID=UPI000F8C6D4C|nr:DUF420 domain-containing protein [Gynurincola endophyticus]
MLSPLLQKNDRKAKWIIGILSAVVLLAVVALDRIHLQVDLGFDVHVFALINAILNSLVTVALIAALFAVKAKKYLLHRNIMLIAMILSTLFLVSYIAHHLFAGETKFGDINLDGIVTDEEKAAVGGWRTFYYIILITHIPLAGFILPFILFTTYRGLTGEWQKHRKIAKITWPLWLYVSITGVLVYILISPYYQ